MPCSSSQMVFFSLEQLLLVWRRIFLPPDHPWDKCCMWVSGTIITLASFCLSFPQPSVSPLFPMAVPPRCAYPALVKRKNTGISCSFSSSHLCSWEAMEGGTTRTVLCASLVFRQNHLGHQWPLSRKEPARPREQSGAWMSHQWMSGGPDSRPVEFQPEVRIWQLSFSDFPEQFQFHAT